mgnify:CR=1 FL=1
MKPKILNDIKNYVSAEMSLWAQGAVPDEIYEERKNACTPCEYLKGAAEDLIGWCGSCGCGSRERARLSIKAKMPNVSCPKDKWGEADAKHPGFKERITALRAKNNA